jgi:hypothetical protein
MSQPLEHSEDSFGCWDWLRRVEKNISLQDLCDFDDILNELKWGTEPKDRTKLDEFLNSLDTDELSGYIINKINKTHCGARACEVYFEKHSRDVRFNRDLLLFQVPKLLYHVSINMPRYTTEEISEKLSKLQDVRSVGYYNKRWTLYYSEDREDGYQRRLDMKQVESLLGL